MRPRLVVGPPALQPALDDPAPALDAAPDVDDAELERGVRAAGSVDEGVCGVLRVVAAPAKEDDVGLDGRAQRGREVGERGGEEVGEGDVCEVATNWQSVEC